MKVRDELVDALVFVTGAGVVVFCGRPCAGCASGTLHNCTGVDMKRPRCKIETPVKGGVDPLSPALWGLLSEGIGLGALYTLEILPAAEHERRNEGTLVAVGRAKSPRLMVVTS